VDPYEPVPVGKRHGYYVSPPIVAGGFKILSPPPGAVRTQRLAHFAAGKWKDDDHLWWTGAKPGDKLDLALSVEKAGNYDVVVTLTKAVDYAVVRFQLDGKPAGEQIDLYNDGVIPSGPISLGTHLITPGEHKLTVEILGANEKAIEAYMFGIDEIILKATK